MHMTFDEFLQLKALALKSSLTGRGDGLWSMLQSNDAALEGMGMKNICFKVDPVTQARFETMASALDLSKQEALSEMLQEMLKLVDEKLEAVGIGKINYDKRLRELGYELGEPDEDGRRSINSIGNKPKGD